jgi:hypothetical protein
VPRPTKRRSKSTAKPKTTKPGKPEPRKARPSKAKLAPSKAKPAPSKAKLAPSKAKPAPRKAKPAPRKAKPAPGKAAGREKPAKLFEDTDLALCVVEGLVQAKLLSTSSSVPGLEPPEDADLDDESESWRDAVVTNQSAPIDQLVALLAQHPDKLPLLKEIPGVLLEIADFRGDEPYEINVHSLDGIEACTGLERIEIWSDRNGLSLAPLTALPRLAHVDLQCAFGVDPKPLLEIRSLRSVTGPIDALDPSVAAELRRRNVEIIAK